ncbi:MAG: glycosyltransferase WbuB [Methylococcales bacterium]|nr:glycosyltransferase WbuB [Methylococcales bacterium]
MKILIYGINYAPELTGIGKYSGEMTEWLVKQGHEVRVITAPPYYPEWQVKEGYQSFSYKQETVNGVAVFRCPLYVPKKPKTVNRLIHLSSFSFSSFPCVLSQIRWQPDVVITVEPTFFCTPAALLLAKLTRAKSVLHIQDFELDAMLGLGMGRQGALSKFALFCERFVMQHFSAISSISGSMLDRVAKKLSNPLELILFPNWVDIDFVTPDADSDYFRALWSIPTTSKVVLYSGNMGKKQGLELVLQAADYFKKQQEVVFVFVGTGAALYDLKQKAMDLNLPSVHFFPLQAYEDLPKLMAFADIHLVVQKKGVADAVLPSKLTTILSAGGTALITAEEHTELHRLCINNPNIAHCVEPENSDDFIAALDDLLKAINVANRSYNPTAREYAEQFLGKQQVLTRFVLDLENMVRKEGDIFT